jgi:hypothetical protein
LLCSPVQEGPKKKSEKVQRIRLPCNTELRTTRFCASALEDLTF